ncbi:unnamed protein product [Gemmata massiliana]|uniref:Uncharacterized protein n=1 Tax=Gemmata massiliana TaxID=1210884 RepID=A0A6P2D9P1_9BACT|nr:hypothetical protein [Gemmata massiliana]VTR97075.1 unnamed protein product [Gemmata massiliana]
MTPDPPSDTPTGILRCATCGKIVECSLAELHQYIKGGWPVCCSEVMTAVASKKTKLDPDTGKV